MKIVHVIPSIDYGGLQKFTIDLSNTLCESGHQVFLVILEKDKVETMKHFCFNKVELFFIEKSDSKIDFSIFGALYKLLSKIQPNVVHTHGISLFYSIQSIVFGNFKFVHTVHNLAQNESGKIRMLIHNILFNYYKVQPVAISDEVEESFQEHYSFTELIKIYNGLKQPIKTNSFGLAQDVVEGFKQTKQTKVLLSVGRVDGQKNHKLLIDGYLKLRDEYTDICLIIIGDMGKKNPFYEELKKYNSTNGIHFIGVVGNVYDYLLCSDIFCLSSIYEGLPISLLEALSAGKICACTPAGGVSSVLKSGMGYVSTDFSVVSYSRTLKEAFNNVENISNATLIEYFNKKYTMDQCCKAYERIYRN